MHTGNSQQPTPHVAPQIDPEVFKTLPNEVQNTILYSTMCNLIERIVHVEGRLSFYDRLRFIGIGGLTVATSVGATIAWAVNHFLPGGK